MSEMQPVDKKTSIWLLAQVFYIMDSFIHQEIRLYKSQKCNQLIKRHQSAYCCQRFCTRRIAIEGVANDPSSINPPGLTYRDKWTLIKEGIYLNICPRVLSYLSSFPTPCSAFFQEEKCKIQEYNNIEFKIKKYIDISEYLFQSTFLSILVSHCSTLQIAFNIFSFLRMKTILKL